MWGKGSWICDQLYTDLIDDEVTKWCVRIPIISLWFPPVWVSWSACSLLLPDRGLKVKVKLLSRVWLFVTTWTIAYQAPPCMGFSRQEYWSGLLFSSPGDLPHPGEGMKLKLKLQYFGHLMWRVDSLEKTLRLGGIGGRRIRERPRMRWLDGITQLEGHEFE